MGTSKKPYFVVIMVQIIYTVMFLISKAAFDGGMNTFVFIFYRQAFATIFLAPFAFYFEWKTAPPLSFATFIKLFLFSLFGVTLSLDLNGVALAHTSATLAAALAASLPAITFFLAFIFGMEKLKVKSVRGMAKLVGILVSIGGVVTLALYTTGSRVKLPFCHHRQGQLQDHHHVSGEGTTWMKGCFLMITSIVLWGLWMVLQTRVIKAYPSKLFLTTLLCFLSSIQSFVIAIIFERDVSAWKLGWDLRLLAVVYCGFIVTGAAFYMQSWVIEKKGPVFLSMFTPLSLLFTLISSAVLLCEIISLGSIVGGVLLIIGLYCVLWGKSGEQVNSHDDDCNDDGNDDDYDCQKSGLKRENDIVCTEVKVMVG